VTVGKGVKQSIKITAAQRAALEATPAACEAGKSATGCFFGLLGGAGVPGFASSADGEEGAANLKAFCGLPPFKSRSDST
jgi:hypothetical protein